MQMHPDYTGDSIEEWKAIAIFVSSKLLQFVMVDKPHIYRSFDFMIYRVDTKTRHYKLLLTILLEQTTKNQL